jgi:hypothetical protein
MSRCTCIRASSKAFRDLLSRGQSNLVDIRGDHSKLTRAYPSVVGTYQDLPTGSWSSDLADSFQPYFRIDTSSRHLDSKNLRRPASTDIHRHQSGPTSSRCSLPTVLFARARRPNPAWGFARRGVAIQPSGELAPGRSDGNGLGEPQFLHRAAGSGGERGSGVGERRWNDLGDQRGERCSYARWDGRIVRCAAGACGPAVE